MLLPAPVNHMLPLKFLKNMVVCICHIIKSIESEMKIKTEHVKDKDIIVTTFHAYINNYFTNCKNDDDLIGFIKKLSSGEKLISRKDCIDIKVFILMRLKIWTKT